MIILKWLLMAAVLTVSILEGIFLAIDLMEAKNGSKDM